RSEAESWETPTRPNPGPPGIPPTGLPEGEQENSPGRSEAESWETPTRQAPRRAAPKPGPKSSQAPHVTALTATPSENPAYCFLPPSVRRGEIVPRTSHPCPATHKSPTRMPSNVNQKNNIAFFEFSTGI